MVNIQKEGFENILNLILLSLSCLLILPAPFIVYFLIKKKYDLPFLKSFCPDQKYPEYMLLLYLRKFTYSLCIISLYGNPYLQVSILTTMNISILVYKILKMPFHKTSNNIKNIFEEFIFLLTILIQYFLVNHQLYDEQERINISWGLIMLFVSVIVIEVISIVLFGIVKLKELYQKFKTEKNKMKIKPMMPSKSFSLENIDANQEFKSIEFVLQKNNKKVINLIKHENINNSSSTIMHNSQEKDSQYQNSKQKQMNYQSRRKKKETLSSFETLVQQNTVKTVMMSNENILRKSNFSKEGIELPYFTSNEQMFTLQKQDSPSTAQLYNSTPKQLKIKKTNVE